MEKIVIDYFTKLDRKERLIRNNLLKNINLTKYKVYLLIHKKAEKPKLARDFKYIYFKKGILGSNLSKKVKTVNPDIIISWSFLPINILNRFSVILNVSSIIDIDSLAKLNSRKITSLGNKLNRYEKLIVDSEYLKLYITNHLDIKKDKIIILNPIIENDFFYENIKEDERLIRQILYIYRISKPYLFVFGRLRENSNLEQILEAFALIYQKIPEHKLVVASPDFKIGWDNKPIPLTKRAKNILEIANKLKITRKIIFTGFIERKHLPVVIKNADLCLNLSDKHSFSNTLVEAISCGCILIIADNPVLKEISANSALVVNQKSSKVIADTIIEIIRGESKMNNLRLKARLRAKYLYSVNNVKVLDKIILDIKNKQKQEVFVICKNKGNLRADIVTLKRLFKIKFNTKIYENFEVDLTGKRLKVFIKKSKLYDKLLFIDILSLKILVKLLIAKFLLKHKEFYLLFTDEFFFFLSRNRKFKQKLILYIKLTFLAFFYKRIFKKFLVKTESESLDLQKLLRINKKNITILPFPVTRIKITKAEVVKKYKLKNYFVITVKNIPDKIFINKLLNKFKDIKILYIQNNKAKSILNIDSKRFISVQDEDWPECVLVSKIYLNFDFMISYKNLLTMLSEGIVYVGISNIYIQEFIKNGINGYFYQKFDEEKLFVQIRKLINSRIQIKDMSKVNKIKAQKFTFKNIQNNLQNINI